MKPRPQGFTKLYDCFVDMYLPEINGSELKLLIIILRQTIGWNKKRDRISHRFFMKKTALSRRSVTQGIASLEHKKMIRIMDCQGNILNAHLRKYCDAIYYEPVFPKAEITSQKEKNAFIKAEKASSTRHYLPITIDRHKRHKEGNEITTRKTDAERLAEIFTSKTIDL